MAALAGEFLRPTETLGGYIFKCSENTLRYCLEQQIFGMSEPYRNSVKAIAPGIPPFLYNCTTHRLHGVFEASDAGGYNIDPGLWPHREIRGLSFYPAQVEVKWYREYEALSREITNTVMQNLRLPKLNAAAAE